MLVQGDVVFFGFIREAAYCTWKRIVTLATRVITGNVNAVGWIGPTHTDVDLSRELYLMNTLWNEVEENESLDRRCIYRFNV